LQVCNRLAMALALGLWPSQNIQGQNFGRLQNSPLTSTDWSTVTGVNYISRSTFLTYLQWAIVALYLKKTAFRYFLS